MSIKKVIRENDQGEPILNEAGNYEFDEVEFPEPELQPAQEKPGEPVQLDTSATITEEQITGWIKKIIEERLKNTSQPLPNITPEKKEEIKTRTMNGGFYPGMFKKGGTN